MKNDAGSVDIAAPSTYMTTGTVARRGEGARANPASAVIAARSTALTSSSIWQPTSRATILFGDGAGTRTQIRR